MKRIAIAVFIAAVSLSACGSEQQQSIADVTAVSDDSPFKGAWLTTPYALPTATFTSTSGQKIEWPQDALPKPVTVVFFGYTNCDDGFCQTQTANIAAAFRGLDAAQQEQVAYIMITSDPNRDTPEVLRAFLNQYSDDFIGYTAPLDVTQLAGLALGVEVDSPPSPLPVDGYRVGHGTQLIGFGPKGTAPVVWTAETPIADIRADIVTLLGGKW